MDGSKPIRGGIPLVFPQFGTGPIMAGQHGFARTLPWDVSVAADQASALCELTDSPATLAAWPYKFRLQYRVAIEADGALKTELRVINTDSRAFQFTSLLHTYLRVPDIAGARVKGLEGLRYADKLNNGQVAQETRATIGIDSEVDRNYISFPHTAALCFPGHTVILTTSEAFPDLVVWNPWVDKAKAMADFGDEEYRLMVCLEAGKVIEAAELAPGDHWEASQTLSCVLSQP